MDIRKRYTKVCLFLWVIGMCFCAHPIKAQSVIPVPLKMEQGTGSFLLSEKTKLYTNLQGEEAALLGDYLKTALSLQFKEGKKKDKQELIKALGLSITPGVPIIGMVTRLTEQKGLDLVKYMLDEIMCTENVAFVILGTGDYEYEEFFRYMEEKYKGRVCSYIAYDNAVAHQIYAGSDLFLMPSKFEPCGISQMIALRYGTLPIVRETGGLRDTVQSYNEYEDTGNGFSFANYNAHEMLGAIRYALQTLQSPKRKHGLIQRAMESDNSFAKSAKIYLDMYNSVL